MEFLHKLSNRCRTRRALFLQRLDGICVQVIHHALVAGLHQPLHHVAAHAAQSNHAQVHATLLAFNCGVCAKRVVQTVAYAAVVEKGLDPKVSTL